MLMRFRKIVIIGVFGLFGLVAILGLALGGVVAQDDVKQPQIIPWPSDAPPVVGVPPAVMS
jgi:hypothetical protein